MNDLPMSARITSRNHFTFRGPLPNMGVSVTYRFECDDCGHVEFTESWPDECPSCIENGRDDETQNRRQAKREAPVSRTPVGEDFEDHRYSAYYGVEWEAARERVLERDGYECCNCGLSDEEHRADDTLFGGGLHIHHKTPAHEFESEEEANAMKNLASLCANCHRKAESGKLTV